DHGGRTHGFCPAKDPAGGGWPDASWHTPGQPVGTPSTTLRRSTAVASSSQTSGVGWLVALVVLSIMIFAGGVGALAGRKPDERVQEVVHADGDEGPVGGALDPGSHRPKAVQPLGEVAQR